MLFYYIKSLKLYFLLLSFISIQLSAFSGVEVSQVTKVSLLEQSEILFEDKALGFKEVYKENKFEPYRKSYLNAGVTQSSVWLRFQLKNSSSIAIKKVLVFSSPLLESIELYRGVESQAVLRGLSFEQPQHRTISYYYDIKLDAKSEITYYVKVYSHYTPLGFAVTLEDKSLFLKEDSLKQLTTILLIGMLVALMLYALGLAFYAKDKSYFYYALYLTLIIYQQFTYVGLTQIYASYSFIVLDMQWAIFKVSILMLSSALFAMHFLKTENIPWLHTLYKWFLLFIILEMTVFSLPRFYNIEIIILTGVLFIVFNLMAGIITYKSDYKEARLFIIGFGTVFVSYFIMIMDALGLISVIQYFPNLLMWCSAIEALVLSLAFSDRYKLLQEAKEKTDKAFLESLKNREIIINNEVKKKTEELNQAVKTKELLLNEVHHRVKNNLQIILSILRLQNDKITDRVTLDACINLENRINAIAKTYSMLLPKENLDAIDMEEYVDSLLWDIHDTICCDTCQIEIETHIDVSLSLKESAYVGLIINELVTNAYKHAFEEGKGIISIHFHKKGEVFTLIVEDNGRGFAPDPKSQSLGLKLIYTLVYDQLEGTITLLSDKRTKYTIRFRGE